MSQKAGGEYEKAVIARLNGAQQKEEGLTLLLSNCMDLKKSILLLAVLLAIAFLGLVASLFAILLLAIFLAIAALCFVASLLAVFLAVLLAILLAILFVLLVATFGLLLLATFFLLGFLRVHADAENCHGGEHH